MLLGLGLGYSRLRQRRQPADVEAALAGAPPEALQAAAAAEASRVAAAAKKAAGQPESGGRSTLPLEPVRPASQREVREGFSSGAPPDISDAAQQAESSNSGGAAFVESDLQPSENLSPDVEAEAEGQLQQPAVSVQAAALTAAEWRAQRYVVSAQQHGSHRREVVSLLHEESALLVFEVFAARLLESPDIGHL